MDNKDHDVQKSVVHMEKHETLRVAFILGSTY